MDISDAVLGKVVAVSTAGLCALLAAWINTYPFLDEECVICPYVWSPQWFLLGSAVCGLAFIGGLMAFTLYHIYPYL